MLYFSPTYLGAVLRTGSTKCLKYLLCDGFALQFVISLKSTRTGKDCTSNALENTSIKNWVIQWNRAEPGETSRQTVSDSHTRTLTCCLLRKDEVLRLEKWVRYPVTFIDSRLSHTPGFSKQMLKTAPYDLELQILFLACFHPLSVENNDTAWISIFINGFLLKTNILLEVFPLHFWQTNNFLNPNGMCKPGCKALLKMHANNNIYFYYFYGTKTQSHYLTGLIFFK